MATKINPDFYGAENTFVTVSGSSAVKRCANTVGQLMSNDIYTGGSFDTTATPWGIGESSVSSDFFFIASKGAEWSIVDYNNQRKNTPIWFYFNSSNIEGGDDTSDLDGSSANSWYYSRAMYKNRMSPDATIYNTEIHSTMTIDENNRIDLPSSIGQYPVTYADYQNLRLVIRDVWVKQEGSSTITRTNMTAIQKGTVTVDKLVRFNFSIYDTNGISTSMQLSIGGSELDIPETFKTCYYDDNNKWVRPWHRISSVGYWYRNSYDQSVSFSVFNTDTGVAYTSAWENLSADDNAVGRPNSNAWGHISPKYQVFNDVSYHWTYGISHYNSDQFVITQINNGDTFTSETLRNFAYMEFDDSPPDKNGACFNAILHEVAFLGFPIVISTSDVAESIGSDKVYLPVFDEHLVTTGEFISGSESLNLPNALWNDIFGAEMPEYDPEYEPDAPIPAGDYGDTTNTGNLRIRIPSDLKVYLMDESTLHQMLYRLNNYYRDKTPDDWTIDFQGVNPSDYILGCYVTRLNLPPSSVGESVKVGVIDLNLSAYTLNQVYDYWCTIDFGTRTIQPRYNDFRDYAPYTSVELYLPLAGTVDLDVNYCMGHNITVKYYYDVLTMSCVAAVYRDNMLYKCSDCKIGAEIPLLSSNMGSYQNQIEQLSVARQRNNIAIATSGAAAIAGTTAAIATGSPMAIIGAAGGFSKLADNIIESSNLDYQFDHIAPSVSVTGAADAQNNLCVGQLMPKLIIKRPVMLSGHNDTIYSKTVGNACCINDYIGSRTGLMVCSNINANDIVNAYGESPSADEINSIKQAFANGIYI